MIDKDLWPFQQEACTPIGSVPFVLFAICISLQAQSCQRLQQGVLPVGQQHVWAPARDRGLFGLDVALSKRDTLPQALCLSAAVALHSLPVPWPFAAEVSAPRCSYRL